MAEPINCSVPRTPIGRYDGAQAMVRPDDLAAVPLRPLMDRHQAVEWNAPDNVVFGCANQAGEGNLNVARIALTRAGLPKDLPASTINRLCRSGMDAVGIAARAIKSGEAQLAIAGGVERVSRAYQDAFGIRSQARALNAQKSGRLTREIVAVTIPATKGNAVSVDKDQRPRETTLDALARLKLIVKPDGTVTAGSASGANDGAWVIPVASEAAAKRHELTPLARVIGVATAGCAPRVMGMGPVLATRKLLERTGIRLDVVEVIELNEAFAAQGIAVLRQLGIRDEDARVNPNGGAIALGHPLGMRGARLVTTAMYERHDRKARYALATMCMGAGFGTAPLIERV